MTTTQMIAGRAARTGTAARASDTPVRQSGNVNRGPVAGAAGIGGIAQPPSDEGQAGALGPACGKRARRRPGRRDKAVPEVLLLCAYNAGRSQTAASLTDRYAHGRVHVRCAGSHPADWLDLTVLEALGEWDIEVEQHD